MTVRFYLSQIRHLDRVYERGKPVQRKTSESALILECSRMGFGFLGQGFVGNRRSAKYDLSVDGQIDIS